MKKLTTAVLIIMLILSLVCLSACGVIFGIFDGLLGGDLGDKGDNATHVHQFDSYFTYSQCTAEKGCRIVGRKGSENTYANDFKYTLTDAKIDQIDAVYDEMLTYLQDGDDFAQFEDLYADYVELFEYVGHQYQVSTVLSDVKYDTTTAKNYNKASKLYNEMFANYYALYEMVYDSSYRDEFFDGWSQDEIDEALYYAEIYGGSADNNNAVDDILAEYEQYMDSIDGSFSTDEATKKKQLNKVGEIYAKLVEANNKIATDAHYDNYMDYAYLHEYNRDYKPSDVAETMRNYVKTYVAPIFINVGMRTRTLYQGSFNSIADMDYYYGLSYDSLFTDTSDADFGRVKTTVDYISDYFKYLQVSAVTTGGVKVDFYGAVEDLFKNGNYFTGEYQGAYTWWIDGIDSPIVYYGENYDSAFTFVHEFGHYYENIYNGSLHLSYDHDETHSQGNEMLFLAWLSQNKPSRVSNGFEMVEVDQLFDMLGNIVIATAVDEFEQAAYTGLYNGQPINCTYAELFDRILSSYKGTYNGRTVNATDFLYSSYWGYVVFNSSAYYVSYAMSALPSLELYAKARSEGLSAARDSYVKLFTFANGHRFVATDRAGNAYLRDSATYQAILNYCGLQGPFEEGLYTTLQTYFASRPDLK